MNYLFYSICFSFPILFIFGIIWFTHRQQIISSGYKVLDGKALYIGDLEGRNHRHVFEIKEADIPTFRVLNKKKAKDKYRKYFQGIAID